MSLWKRGRHYWLDVTVNGQRYREPLGTTDWQLGTVDDEQFVLPWHSAKAQP